MPIWDKIAAAATAQEPSSPALAIAARRSNKRPRTDDNSSDNEDDHPGISAPPQNGNANLIAIAKRVTREKRLKPEQGRDLQDFATYSMHAQNIIIMAHMFGLDNKFDGLVPPPAAFAISESLMTNLTSYAHGIILSSKISNYKGTVPLNHLLEIVKTLRFDLPPGIEHDMAKWEKVRRAAGQSLTQVRGKIKKLLVKAMKPDDAHECQGLYPLTCAILKNTAYKITIPLMARVALMRQVYTEDPGDDFWNTVDSHLVFIRGKAPTAAGMTRVFKMLLDDDRDTYGPRDEAMPEVDDVVDELQQKVDKAIEEAAGRVGQTTPEIEDADDDDHDLHDRNENGPVSASNDNGLGPAGAGPSGSSGDE